MTRLAIISDVHADVEALRDALGQIERLRCDVVVCAGDIVDWGRFPEETIALLAERKIPTIRGNHDRWALERARGERPAEADDGPALSRKALRFLGGLATGWEAVIEGVQVVMRHAAPGTDMNGIYPNRTIAAVLDRHLRTVGTDILLVGHTHIPCRISMSGNRVIANPGTLCRAGEHAADGGESATGVGAGAAADAAKGPLVYEEGTGRFERAPAVPVGTFGVLHLPSRRFTVHRAADGEEIEIARVSVP